MRSFFSEAQRNGVFASDDVLHCEAMCADDVSYSICHIEEELKDYLA